MSADRDVISIIEDYALLEDFLLHVSRCVKSGAPVTDHIPSLSNSVLMDAVGNICEGLNGVMGSATSACRCPS